MNTKLLQFFVAFFLFFLLANLSSFLLALDGKALYTQKLCNTCHGEAGKKPIAPVYPKLNGQNKQYLIEQTNYIISGKRNSGLSTTMSAMYKAIKLSKPEIEAISDYLSKVK